MKIEPDNHGGYLIQFEFYALHFDTLDRAESWIEAKYAEDMRRDKKLRFYGDEKRLMEAE